MSNPQQDAHPDANGSDPSQSPPTGTTNSARPQFSMLRVLVTVLLLGGVGAGVFFFLTQEKTLPPLVEFSGTVSYLGKPLTTGGIFTETFEPGLIGAVGALDENGRFTLMTNGVPGAYVGRHRLAVSAMGAGNPPQPIVPAHYVQPRSSGLMIEVTADPGKNTCEITLVDPEPAEKESPQEKP